MRNTDLARQALSGAPLRREPVRTSKVPTATTETAPAPDSLAAAVAALRAMDRAIVRCAMPSCGEATGLQNFCRHHEAQSAGRAA